jgi:hypothetical protein
MTSDTPVPLPQHGGCVCGETRYALNAAPLIAYACHCHDCQKRSGSAFALSLLVRSGDVSVTGDLEVIAMTAPSGRRVDHHVCPRCRFRLFGRGPASPDFTTLRAGTLDDTSWIAPIAQTWVDSALPWALIPGVRVVSPEAFDFLELGRAWAETAPRFEVRTPPG